MMSAVMAAGRMRKTLAEGPLHGPRGTVPSAQRRSSSAPPANVSTTGRWQFPLLTEGMSSPLITVMLNQTDLAATFAPLRKALAFSSSELWPPYLRIFF